MASVRLQGAGARLEWIGVTTPDLVSMSSADWLVGLMQGAMPQVLVSAMQYVQCSMHVCNAVCAMQYAV